MPIDETILRVSAEALQTTLIGFPARHYELHLSASYQDTASALQFISIGSLPRYCISIQTAILKEETDHRFMEDRASLVTMSTLATWLKAMQGRFCYVRKALPWQQGYKCFKYIQKKGDMIITWPGVYHSGINIG